MKLRGITREAEARMRELERAVLDAAHSYVAEVTNPCPDLAYRSNCRARLVEADDALRAERMRHR